MPSISRATRLRALRRGKGRREHGMLLVEGPRVAMEVLDADVDVVEGLYTEEATADPVIADLLARLGERRGVVVEVVTPAEMDEFSDTVNPQGFLLVVRVPDHGLDDIGVPRVLVLDAVQDPGNVGTLIRTAEALGAGGVVVLPGTADPWSPKVVRSAAGASFRLPVVTTGVEELARWCGQRNVALLVAATGGEAMPRAAGPRDAAIVLGNESAGVSDAIRAIADEVVGIPQAGKVDSLNVAVAGAIMMDRTFGG